MQACLCVGNTRPGVSGRESRHMLQRTVTDPCSSCLQPVKNNKAPERQTPTRSNDLRTVHQQYTNDVRRHRTQGHRRARIKAHALLLCITRFVPSFEHGLSLDRCLAAMDPLVLLLLAREPRHPSRFLLFVSVYQKRVFSKSMHTDKKVEGSTSG